MFLTALSPGQIFRYFERNRRRFPFVDSLLLSDPAGSESLRALIIEGRPSGDTLTSDGIVSVGPSLSEVFPPRVTLLWRHGAASSEGANWGSTVWENGMVIETDEHSLSPPARPSLLSKLPGMQRKAPHSADVAWALARGLPIDRVPAAGLRRKIPIVDYVTVAQLDQRSLLVENSPRLYRFPLNSA
jgi:hypothetical protein